MDTPSTDGYTFGIEEEYFLTDLATRQPPPRVRRGLVDDCRVRLGDAVTYELKQAQIEVATPVLDDAFAAQDVLRHLRRGIADVARGSGLGIVAAGSHPMGSWRDVRPTRKARYRRIIETYQIIGRRDLLCGLHVHVAPPPGVDRVELMNRLMPQLPLFLALSTSSPFWSRRHTGLLSYRQAAYDEFPRSGTPDFFDDERDYDAFVERLVRADALRDGSELWWNIRPSRRYPTLELRIADACTHLEDTVALASLFRCLVRAHVRLPELGRERGNGTRRLIDENRWRAQRYGIDAQFIDEAGGQTPVRERVGELRALVEPDAQALGCVAALAGLDGILARGTSAQAQLDRYEAEVGAGAHHLDALRATVDWLLETTQPGQG
ncbi:carboxylate-amine ligase [Tahibacter soli]|uniref:Putative glutamate--cysteine ligase 2 n=1 Tax=Tahibacter soli TaxID=2983605 RepID=A0A9X3YMR0_9GAMM|nr:carboxylate-amine ligase [Tahibacter soli]MDC8014522.1 carboxylate-amine ligase [Tahibacter soli]